MQSPPAVAVMRNHIVFNLLAKIGLDNVDTIVEQFVVAVGPELRGGWMGEIDNPRRRQRCEHFTEWVVGGVFHPIEYRGLAVNVLQQPALGLKFRKQRVVN